MRLLVAPLLLALAPGCGPHRLYEGPARPNREVARVEMHGNYVPQPKPGDMAYEVEAATVDGVKLAKPRARIALLPGPHEFEIRRSHYEYTDWGDYETNQDRPLLEVSGGIRLDNVRAYAEAGADRISIGGLTHSAPALDLSMKVEPTGR